MPTESLLLARKIARRGIYIKENIVYLRKSFSYKYLRYRFMRPLLKFYNKLLTLKQPVPWMSPASIAILKALLHDRMVALEYGSGSSTLFFHERVKNLISVEHDKWWYKGIKKKLKQLKVKNVNYKYIPPSPTPEKYTGDDIEKVGLMEQHLEMIRWEYVEYFEYANKFANDYFDLIIIDGRARVECSINCIDKLKPGGIFILDNSERNRYQPVHALINDWPSVHTTTGLTDTMIWFKPILNG